MTCTLRYGTSGLSVDLDDAWDITVISKKEMPVSGDPAATVRAALESPLASGRLEEEARGCATACILVCDITRPVPNGLVLRPLIERLERAGVKRGGITVLVATGLHRPNEGAELEQVIGDEWVMGHVTIVNHFAQGEEDHVDAGTTRGGIPVRLDRRFLEADVRIAVGLVEPHFMAGWSGGRKIVLPGIASAGTIRAFHSARILSHPSAETCTLAGNPLHEAQNEVLGTIGRTLGVSFVIDEARRLSFASFGAIAESHAAAVAFAEPWFRIPVEKSFPVVLCSGAGFPLDTTYYQAVKGFCCGASILSPGGDLFVAAECSQGMGSAEFRRSQQRLRENGGAAFLAEARSRPRAEIDEWETFMLLKALGAGTAHLYAGGLTDEDRALTGVRPCPDLAAGVGAAMRKSGGRRIAVIPEGPYVAPYVEAAPAGPVNRP
jgi:nickel-dependent lactate racemase